MKTNYDKEIESFIEQELNNNFESLQLEGGHSISSYQRYAALTQVLLYWKKMRGVAESVTNTEIRLCLPEQKTESGIKFSLEGVVDIVCENDQTKMYDIKTHDSEEVRASPENYEKQLNVYAYIWQKLRNQKLDEAAIIGTKIPLSLSRVLKQNDDRKIELELNKWNPLVSIPFNDEKIKETIEEFAEVVEQIENKKFSPPTVAHLKEKIPGKKNKLFAVEVCRNCDARFSCESYRIYASTSSSGRSDTELKKYLNDYGESHEAEEWKFVNLEQNKITGDIDNFLE